MQVGGRQEKGPGKYEREQTKEFGTEKKGLWQAEKEGNGCVLADGERERGI